MDYICFFVFLPPGKKLAHLSEVHFLVAVPSPSAGPSSQSLLHLCRWTWPTGTDTHTHSPPQQDQTSLKHRDHCDSIQSTHFGLTEIEFSLSHDPDVIIVNVSLSII